MKVLSKYFSRNKLSFQPDSNLVHQGIRTGQFGLDGSEVEKLVIDDIKKLGLVYQTIDNFLVVSEILKNKNFFLRPLMSSSRLKCSKDPIPDGKEASIILVKAIPISSVVNLMVGRGIEDQPKRSKVSNQLRMNPELEEKNEL